MDWKILNKESQIDRIKEESFEKPVIIFKHSTTCPISSIAKLRLDDDLSVPSGDYTAYYLDLLSYRMVSNKVAEVFKVYHESPQVIIIKDGEASYDESHLDISVQDLAGALK